MDGLPDALFQAQFPDDLVDPGPALVLGGVLREAQLGGIGEGASYGQLGVQDVVLRYEADALAQLGVVAVQVAAVVQDRAPVGGALAGQGVEQRGLSGAAGPDDGEQALLADGKETRSRSVLRPLSTVTDRSCTSSDTSPVSTYS